MEDDRRMVDIEKLKCGEPLYVGQCTYTKEVMIKFFRRSFPTWKKIISIAGIVISILFSLMFFVLDRTLYGVLFLLYALVFLLLFYRPYLLARRYVKLAQNVCHALDRTTTYFYEDGFFVHDENTGGELTFAYSQVSAVHKVSTIYFLRTAGVSVLLDKDGFQVGMPSDFEAFIQKKTQKKISK